MRQVVLSYPMHRRLVVTDAKKVCGGVNERTYVAKGFAGVSCIVGTIAISCSTSLSGHDLQDSALSPTLRFDKSEIVEPVSTSRPFR